MISKHNMSEVSYCNEVQKTRLPLGQVIHSKINQSQNPWAQSTLTEGVYLFI